VLDRLSRDLWCGRRNYALLLTMYNFGARVARVSEISGLRQSHVTLGAKSYVQLHRKGRKDRSILLWPRTARILKDLFRELGATRAGKGVPEHSRRAADTFRHSFVVAKSGRESISPLRHS
jgi:integrase